MDVGGVFSTKRQAITKAKSSVLAAVVAASIVVSFSIVTLNFLWNLRGYNARVTAEKEIARNQLEDNWDNAEDLVERFQQFEQGGVTSQEVLDALPSKYDYAALVTSMDQLSRRSGMIMTNFGGTDNTASAVQSASAPTPIEMPFTIAVVGDYESLQDFVKSLSLSIRPMKIQSIEISGTNRRLQANISMMTYYQPAANLTIEEKTVQ